MAVRLGSSFLMWAKFALLPKNYCMYIRGAKPKTIRGELRSYNIGPLT
jgi:hypothetical protein